MMKTINYIIILLLLISGCKPQIPEKVYSNAFEITDSIINAEKTKGTKSEFIRHLIFKKYEMEFTLGNIKTATTDSLVIDCGGGSNPTPSTLVIDCQGRLKDGFIHDADSNGSPEVIALIKAETLPPSYKLIINEYQDGFPKKQSLPAQKDNQISLYDSFKMIDSTSIILYHKNKANKPTKSTYNLFKGSWE